MVVRRISSREARDNFAELIGQVYYTKEPVIVERKGKPYAVLISPEQYRHLEGEREQAWKTIEAIQERNADKDPDDVLRDVTEAVEEVRQERSERQRKTSGRH
jgi:prevent-host-death family protein